MGLTQRVRQENVRTASTWEKGKRREEGGQTEVGGSHQNTLNCTTILFRTSGDGSGGNGGEGRVILSANIGFL